MMNTKEKSRLGKIAWGLTGAGHFLRESVDILLKLDEVDIFLSNAAREILPSYGLLQRLEESGHRLFPDTSAGAWPVTKLYTGEYCRIVIAPVTANTVAKLVHGIADNLISNLFAQAGKCQIPTVLLPCDVESDIDSRTPRGDLVQIRVRAIDRENIERLKAWPGVHVTLNPPELERVLGESKMKKS